jgi:pimeloyl-ACP methyl ester carboxylesterase
VATVNLPTGTTIGYADEGTGHPVVLLPGTAVDHTVFLPGEQIPTLAQQFRVIAVDPRGTGESTRPDADYGAADLAGDVIALLDALSVERAHIVGLSMGATLAARVAAEHPERVSGLVLYHPWSWTDEFLHRMFTIWRFLYAEADPVVFGQATLWWLLSRQFILAQPEVVDGIAADVFAGPNAPDRRDYVRHVDINLAHDLRAALPSIIAPTLVVTGEDDRVIPSAYSEEVADAIPGADYHLFTGPGSSHALFLERAAELNALTVKFLQSTD